MNSELILGIFLGICIANFCLLLFRDIVIRHFIRTVATNNNQVQYSIECMKRLIDFRNDIAHVINTTLSEELTVDEVVSKLRHVLTNIDPFVLKNAQVDIDKDA